MSRTVYTKEGGQVVLSEQGDVQNYTHIEFDVFKEYNLTDPVAGLKKVWNRIPKNSLTRPIFIWLGCGAEYSCVIQATSEAYGSAIIFGYTTPSIIYIRLLNGVWC